MFKKRYTRETTKESSNVTVLSRDLIKELVDKEADLDECLRRLSLENNSQKIISNHSKSSSPVSQKVRKLKESTQDQDVFMEMIIDELKKENRDLKFALVARNQRLEDAAIKVTQLVEQNTYLSQKVERAALDHTEQARDLIEAQKRYHFCCTQICRKNFLQ